MSKKSLFLTSALMLLSFQGVLAFQPKETARYFNGPTVKQVTSTTANLSLSQSVLSGLTDEERQGVYFQYYETQLVCIAIYPTPEYCLPKKTEVGKADVTVTNLKPDTSYTVMYKRDNTIRCITTPCPGNEFESLTVEFKTTSSGSAPSLPAGNSDNVKITKNLSYKSRGEQVVTLQTILIQQGYLTGEPTGYFGVLTLKAVKAFQKAHYINPTGLVGPATRGVLTSLTSNSSANDIAEVFEGTVTAYSTACFADGECSITVDGKKVVTTIGWSQAIVGKVTGIPDFGSIENNIGAHAKVYAKKTADGYTLYGSSDYYVDITPKTQSKLPEGSSPSGNASALQNTTWVWQKTLVDGINAVTPKMPGVFTITFGTDGNISGKTDCNGFFGSYTPGSDGFIKFGAFGMSKMYCENSQEQVFVNAVQQMTNYVIDASGNLMLKNGKDTMHFVKSN